MHRMTSGKSVHPYTPSKAARLLLAMLLALGPVLTFAAGMPLTISADQDPAAHAEQPMPCHGGTGQKTEAAAQSDCPHCSGGDRLSPCHCCEYAAPAGLISIDLNPPPTPVDGIRSNLHANEPLPDSPGDRLYRPPIIQS